MSDLISRKALLREIHGSNRPEIYDGAQEVDWIMECINQTSTAYDVDKVVKQLYENGCVSGSKNGFVLLNKAIPLVKGGGQGE